MSKDKNNCASAPSIYYLTENDRPFPPKDYKGEGDNRYEYRNDLLLYQPTEGRFWPFRHFITDIKVTEGKIIFYLEDEETLTFEDRFLINNFRTDSEGSVHDKYESFLGKKSILKHHFNVVFQDSILAYNWPNKVDSYYTYDLTECIHDGVTSFIIRDYGECEDYFEYIQFPDGVYNRDGVKIKDIIDEIDEFKNTEPPFNIGNTDDTDDIDYEIPF